MINYYINDMQNNKEYVISINSSEKVDLLKNFHSVIKECLPDLNEENYKNMCSFNSPKMLMNFLISSVDNYLKIPDTEKNNMSNPVTKLLIHLCSAFCHSYDLVNGLQLTTVSIFKNKNMFSCTINSQCTFSNLEDE